MIAQPTSQQRVTQLLEDWSGGDAAALDKLVPLVEPELHRLAQRYMCHERPGHTLQATALVNEAYLRLVDRTHPHWRNRAHFFAAAAQLMRRIMVDHARQRSALKRGADGRKVTLNETALLTQERAAELLALDEALEKLGAVDARQCQVVEMRYFGGLTIEEVAEVLKVRPRTVVRDWTLAKAWLYAALSGEDIDEA
jgi:RNA polymerase sigma-70 factor, ECF subfamily